MLTPHRIPRPDWARDAEPDRHDAFPTEAYLCILQQRDAILQAVDMAVASYLNDADLTVAHEADGFPARSRLTGAYYLSEEHYWVSGAPWFARQGQTRSLCFSIMVHCLEHPWHPGQVDTDYLGLEIHFQWDEASDAFQQDGVDSSSI
ncbi:hypothetical protein [Leeia sp.]|uniref:hypothetical protein n=1 Tax=Leeia sp. TaxID=2884678 RepID=UPI0035AFF200